MKQVIEIVCYLFVYAAILKFVKCSNFLSKFKLQHLTTWSILFLSFGLRAGESLIVLLHRRVCYLGLIFPLLVLMFCFSNYVLVALVRAFGEISYMCGGILDQLPRRELYIFNILFTAIAFVGLHLQSHYRFEIFLKYKRLTTQIFK